MVTEKGRKLIEKNIHRFGDYDPETLEISREGSVSAKKDQNLTFRPDRSRYYIGDYKSILKELIFNTVDD